MCDTQKPPDLPAGEIKGSKPSKEGLNQHRKQSDRELQSLYIGCPPSALALLQVALNLAESENGEVVTVLHIERGERFN